METQITYGRKLWWPYSGLRWPPPRLLQLMARYICEHDGHRWSPWRVETPGWFEYVDAPEPWAWHVCQRGCGAIERVPGPVPVKLPVTP